MLYVLAFAAGLAAGAILAAVSNLRYLRADEAAEKRRARLHDIHLQALERTVHTLVAEDGQEITPAKRAMLRQYRIMYQAMQDEKGDAVHGRG